MVDERKVPEGYKVTEVGIIPDEWEVIDFNDCFELLPNNTFSRAELNYNCGKFKNIHYGDVLIKFPSILDCSAMEIPFINTNHVIKNNRALLKDGDIIFADTAEDETVGKAIEIFNAGSQELVSGLHTIPCRPKVIFEPKWLGYYLNHSIYHDQLLPYITGTKVSAISKSSIKETKVVKPLPAEQKAIAEALSDTDNLIQSVKKLIDKKKKIKQGAMQQLLTGKKRLLGFSGEWEHRNVESFGEIITGGTPPTGVKAYWNGSIPWVTPTDITSTKNIYTTDRKITNTGLSKLRKLPKNSVLITCIASIGKNAVIKKDGACNQQINAIIPSNGYDSDFLYYLFESNKSYLLSNAGITATNIISKKDFALIEFLVPKLDEQKAIAQVLSDMDSEIEALEEKLEKYKTIKQGMMQELLTGRIRLI